MKKVIVGYVVNGWETVTGFKEEVYTKKEYLRLPIFSKEGWDTAKKVKITFEEIE
jgi:hypothetical protein